MTNVLTPIPGDPHDPTVEFINTLLRQDPLVSNGDELRSLNGTFQLILQAADGNLVLYIDDQTGDPNDARINRPIWSPYTQDRGTSYAIMQWDGNFVVYDGSGSALWSTQTSGNEGAKIILQDDGNLVIYTPDGLTPIWQSATSAAEAPGVHA